MATTRSRGRTRRRATTPQAESSSAAVGYVRVSREEQVREGVSLEAQESRLRDYAKFHNLDLVHIYRDEGVSGGTPLGERKDGGAMARAVARGDVGVVLAVKLDRVFRDAVDCMQRVREWDRAGVGLHLLDIGGGQAVDTRAPTGRFFLHVIAAAAEMELNRIRERTSDALAHKKARGDRLGTTPLGYVTPEPHAPMQVDPAGFATVRTILRLRAIDGESYRDIVCHLMGEGRSTARGKGWHANTVRRVWRDRTRYRVPFGLEEGAGRVDEDACPECGVQRGQVHSTSCTREECATCRRPACTCAGHSDHAAQAKERRRRRGMLPEPRKVEQRRG